MRRNNELPDSAHPVPRWVNGRHLLAKNRALSFYWILHTHASVSMTGYSYTHTHTLTAKHSLCGKALFSSWPKRILLLKDNLVTKYTHTLFLLLLSWCMCVRIHLLSSRVYIIHLFVIHKKGHSEFILLR